MLGEPLTKTSIGIRISYHSLIAKIECIEAMFRYYFYLLFYSSSMVSDGRGQVIRYTYRFIALLITLSLLLFSVMLVPVSADENPAGWSDILSEDFEGDFPGNGRSAWRPARRMLIGVQDYLQSIIADPYDGNYAYCAKEERWCCSSWKLSQ